MMFKDPRAVVSLSKDPRALVSLSNWWCCAWHAKSSALTAFAPAWLGCLAGTGASPSVMADATLEDFISASLAAAWPPRLQTEGASIQDFDQEPNPQWTSSFGSSTWKYLRCGSSQYSWQVTAWPTKAANDEGTWIYVPRQTQAEETSQSSSRPLTLEASPKAKASPKRRGRRSPPPGDESSGIGERAEEETLTNDPK